MNSVIDGINYGPLAGLLGQWSGNRGLDVSPDNQAQDDKTAFTDELTFSVAGAAGARGGAAGGGREGAARACGG